MLHNAAMANRFNITALGCCLVETLTADLLSRTSQEVRETLVLLPTRRLQLHLSAALCRSQAGASWLPRLRTWDQFVSESIEASLEENHNQELVMVSGEAELLMRELLDDGEHTVPNARQAHELLHLLKELWRHGVRDSASQDMKTWLERQWHLSDEGARQITGRIDSVFTVLAQFEDLLKAHGYGLEEARLHAGLKRIEKQMADGAWDLPAKRLIISGLTSLPLSQADFLEALVAYAKTDKCTGALELWLDETWKELDLEAPLRRLHKVSGSPRNDGPGAEKNVKLMHSCLHPTQEVLVALKRAMTLRSQGVPWHQIIIAVPDEKLYASTFAVQAERLGIPHNIPLARPWAATTIGQWVKIYMTCLGERTTQAFMHLLRHPLTKEVLRGELSHLEVFFSREELWLEALSQAPYQLKLNVSFSEILRRTRLPADLVQPLECAWRFLMGPTTRSPQEVIAWWQGEVFSKLRHHVEATGFKNRSSQLEKIAFDAVDDALSTLANIQGSLWQHVSHAGEALKAIHELASTSSPRDTGEPLSGLQIISVTEARYVPCHALIMVGLAEGIFPHKLPQDSLIDNTLKRAAGMPGWRQLESLEETTFQLLVTRIPHVELIWPEAISEGLAIRSRWVERLAAEGTPIIVHGTDELASSLATRLEEPILPSEEPGSEGKTEDRTALLATVSARSLKAFMTCPYQFLLQRRRVSSLRCREPEDALDLGQRLHQIVEYACGHKGDLKFSLSGEFQWRDRFASKDDVEAWAQSRLQYFSQRLLNDDQRRNLTVIEVVNKGWPALAKTWGEFFTCGWNPAHAKSEWPIVKTGENGIVSVDVARHRIAVTGVVDLLHQSLNGHWSVIDFKTGHEPTMSDVRYGWEPQLLLYAMCVDESLSHRPQDGMVAYWSLRHGRLTEIARGSALPVAVGETLGRPRQDLPTMLSNFRIQWGEQLTAVSARERFFADPQHCGFCEYSNICRKDDPRFQATLKGSSPKRTAL